MGVSDKARQALIAKFRTVALDRVQKLNSFLLDLEKEPDNSSLVDQTLREIHTLKGEAKLMGFSDVNLVAHKTEDLLIGAKDLSFRIPPDFTDLILTGLDAISALLQKKSGSDEVAVDLTAFVKQVELTLEGSADAAQELTSIQEPIVKDRAQRFARTSPVREEHFIQIELEKIERLTDLTGNLLSGQANLDESIRPFGRIIDAFEDDFRNLQSLYRNITHFSKQQVKEGYGNPTGGEDREFSHDLHEIQSALRQINSHIGEMRSQHSKAIEDSFSQQIFVSELEEAVRKLRLIPLGSLFERYRRAVRDLAKEQRKMLKLVISGGNVEVDKQVYNELSESLLHLVRNSVDHGIENPIERKRRKKSEEGTILLAAQQYGSVVELTVRDDGQGFDPALIRQTAIKRGIMTEQEAEKLDDEGLITLIFKPGFSTRSEASDISGRGVGLDVVKQTIESMGGLLRVQSEIGQGATFRLTVPVSITLTRAVIVEIRQRRYAIHSESVSLVTELEDKDVVMVGNRRMFHIEEKPVVLEDLGIILGGSAAAFTKKGTSIVVMLSHGDKTIGIRVDRHLGEREVLLKALDPFLEGLRLISGSTVLEQGDVALVLNIPELLRLAGEQVSWTYVEHATSSVSHEKLVLVAEDSELTRDFVVEILRRNGYRVIEAVDGQDALRKAVERPPDLIISDLEMPIMDGLELVKNVRRNHTLKERPVIVFTTRGSEKDKQRALEAGADAYLVKTEFREDLFISSVERFIGKPKGKLR